MTRRLEKAIEEAGFPHKNSLMADSFFEAARLDAEDAYRRGVEDAESLRILKQADEHHDNASKCYLGYIGGGMSFVTDETSMAILTRTIAFKGARGIARVEIRQRLERLKEGN